MKGEENKLVIQMSSHKSLCVVAGGSGGESHVPVHRLGYEWLVKLSSEIL